VPRRPEPFAAAENVIVLPRSPLGVRRVASEIDGDRRLARAIVSVQDKTGVVDLARELRSFQVELWATSGSRRALTDAGLEVRSVEELTGVDAWFGGRVKTLHPAVFGGILAPRTDAGRAEAAAHGVRTFDLVVVNFYPFVRHLAEAPAATDREEFVDIGGVSLARAAAKNHADVTVASDPADYPAIVTELRERNGRISAGTRRRLAVATFARCSRYDAAIALGLAPAAPAAGQFPSEVRFGADTLTVRYGENPHQAAKVYAFGGPPPLDAPAVPIESVQGDPLSYTNLLDLDAALGLVEEFSEPAAAVVKHATPCGVASAPSLRAALEGAVATDPVARYGCAIAVNRPPTPDDLAALHGVFVDLLAAPELSEPARAVLTRRKKVKVVRVPILPADRPSWDARTALGRLLVQEADRRPLALDSLKRVAGPALTAEELATLAFAWSVVRHAKSNAIVLARGRATVGVGSGQPTRVKAVELACEVAGPRARGALLASDAFFPFADGIEAAARVGVRGVLQPGGSVRDPEVIAAAERAGMAMYFTGWRVFRH
jgi:phosphoribosylaminoimidazolecarboxamide formyltransferase / IMP cyclohydrolase